MSKTIQLPYLHAGKVIINRIDEKPKSWCKEGHKGWFTEYKKHVELCSENGIYPIGFVQFKAISSGLIWNDKKNTYETPKTSKTYNSPLLLSGSEK